MATRIRYRDAIYQVEGGHWRGKDGHAVHFLTWVTDDLRRLEILSTTSMDIEVASAVVEKLGEDAFLVPLQ